jgi:hypothetical protein
MKVTISQGTISGSDGNYIVRVDKPGRIILTIYNKNKVKGLYSFDAVLKKQN